MVLGCFTKIMKYTLGSKVMVPIHSFGETKHGRLMQYGSPPLLNLNLNNLTKGPSNFICILTWIPPSK